MSSITKRYSGPKAMSAARLLTWVIALFYAKFLIFDLIWACDTTFSGFQFPWGWLTKLSLSALLASPLLLWRDKWCVATIGLIVDIWLIANLMYFRTYYTVIPLASYTLVGNLADFQQSVWESLRWIDIIFPITTIAVVWRLWRVDIKGIISRGLRRVAMLLAALFAAPLTIVALYVAIMGGYKTAYDDLMYDYSTCGAAVYTIPGVMLHEVITEKTELTPELKDEIDSWLDNRPADLPLPYTIDARDNCVILLCESLESWVIGATVEGVEITPFLNSCVADTTATLYAPNVQSQVGGARSIDAQLIIHTGLLPVSYGAYSSRFPHHTYMSLDKAFKEKHGPRATTMSFTVDKKTVWNAAIVAQDFGYDRLVDKPYFTLDVATGPCHRLGDESFLRQSYEKIAGTDLWPDSANVLLQCVTYSGHTPFTIPDELKRVSFSDRVPERLRRYMEVANYTDRAIEQFVTKLRANPKFASTMIVITGDHEGIGVNRADYVKDPETAQWLSDKQFVPLLVLNSPVSARYDEVMGQIDIYPTLLDLLGLDDYPWRGLGQSILRPGKLPFAITQQGELIGRAAAPDSVIDHAKRAYHISDLMICCDYFK